MTTLYKQIGNEVVEMTADEVAAIATNEAVANNLFNRNTRNQLLSDSDWTQIPDSPLSDADKALWVTYRTALRNLPDHANWPNLEADDWPTAP